MHKNFFQFVKITLINYFQGLFNLFLFLPYFFSILAFLRTLFTPWKNMVSTKKERGFSLQEWTIRMFFNFISCCIGFSMRFLIILFYFLIQIVLVVSAPISLIVLILLLPFLYFISLIKKSEEEKKQELKKNFIKLHLLEQKNYQAIEKWFENLYLKQKSKSQWWKLQNLFTIPPIGRDWAVGYTPTLDKYSEELTTPKYQSKIKNIIGRKKEIQEIERALLKNKESNVLIVGEEGIGKHTIVDLFSKKLYEGLSSPLLMYKRVLKLNMEKVLDTYIDQKQRENFFESILKEALDAKNTILLLDNFEKYIFCGHGNVDMTISIEKYAQTPNIHFIGMTSPFAYQKFVFPKEKLRILFTNITVHEVTKEQALEIILFTASRFEKRYGVIIPYKTIYDIINKSEFYITQIPFPEKAIELLDSVCIYTKEVKKQTKVLPEYINEVLSEKTHIPTKLTENIKQKLLNLKDLLNYEVIDQQQAMEKISSSMQNSFLLLGKRKKPLASFLFLGSTGVGKTETAKVLSKEFFGSKKYIIRFDMSSYQTKEDISKLIGSTDTNNPGLLTQKVRETPYGVLLLDEIEKADKDLINIFLTILDEGYFTDGFGKRVDCKSLVIIATSNVREDYNQVFDPEFLNRFDGIITYNLLNKQTIIKIAWKIIKRIKDNFFKLHKIRLEVSQEYVENLVNNHYNQEFGARDMQRLIESNIQSKVSKMILEDKIKEGEIVKL